MALRRTGKMDEKVFAESRLRRGCYGQRYDNGHRHDGIRTQQLDFMSDMTKGPDTFWDAPGMQRIKIPFGGVTPDQLDTLAELAEAVEHDAALHARADLADVVAHPPQRQDLALPEHAVAALDAHRVVAQDLAVCHQTASRRAALADREDLADLGVAVDDLLEARTE